MDKHFQIIAIAGVILLGFAGAIIGAMCWQNAAVAIACFGLATTSLGILGGVMNAPKVPGITATVTTEPPAPDATQGN